jgi:hypothetical protein
MRVFSLILLAAICVLTTPTVRAFSATPSFGKTLTSTTTIGNILILDHLNLNHEKGRHDWLKAFYFDFLQCTPDPRKQENLDAGKKTVWANIGANQFHLPEGKEPSPGAQVLQGFVTLAYPDLTKIQGGLEMCAKKLQGSKFACSTLVDGTLAVTDPWGSSFRLVAGNPNERDVRGQQPGSESSEGLALRDLTIYAPANCNMAGIGRFYEQILGAPVRSVDNQADNKCVVVVVGPRQTLTFQQHPDGLGSEHVYHHDLRDEQVEPPTGFPAFMSNYGPHVSMYVADLAGSYQRAQALGVAYVNPRFKRRAYTLDEAITDCMFRCLDIVDPENPQDGVILQLEHEVRSVVNKDGSMYTSCPFDKIPESCK